MIPPNYQSDQAQRPPQSDEITEQVNIAIDRIRAGRSAKSILLIGPARSGKTALLHQLSTQLNSNHAISVDMAASQNSSLSALLLSPLHHAVLHMQHMEIAREKTQRSLRVLGSFINTVSDNTTSFSALETEVGMADNGNLDSDLCDLFLAIGEAAKECDTAVILFIDNLQHVQKVQLSALIGALHRCTQMVLPVMLIGTGNPSATTKIGHAKGYAERLFEIYLIPRSCT